MDQNECRTAHVRVHRVKSDLMRAERDLPPSLDYLEFQHHEFAVRKRDQDIRDPEVNSALDSG